MTRFTDHHVGRVLDFLAELGELDNTLVMLASDNGASAEGGVHGSFNELQFPNRVEASVEQNLVHLDDWGGVRSYPNYAWGWAWAGNTPLRRWKRYTYEGGVRDPLIVRWPAGAAEAYERLETYFAAFDCPSFWLPGNHDSRAAMEATVTAQPRLCRGRRSQ